ncbi:uncharacterized protein LOC114178650 [Vigna unguiculata]|uniref:F-box associated beta-propeller type 1 domain-containing protein n=1 Tax=Vigna unguiculata TaxID=3917 RepID=A0A4D6L822_VIGUN|nr:uncharacterized protein LOC114178650 [Vigna unguiculata]QCD84545.1 hypothetical protein DEO72_LG2g4900 [Vigna unguiculata]
MKSLLTRVKSFFSNQFLRFTSRNTLLILDRFHWNGETYDHDLFLLNVKEKKLKPLNVPKVTDSEMGFKMVGSCNGLLCAIHYSLDPNSTIILWNPTTGQTKRIIEPQTALLPYMVPPHCLVGFYFNKSDSDYQVLRVHSFEDTNEEVCLGDSLTKTCAVRVEKYSLREGLWSEIQYCDNQCVSVNGCLFWTENSVTVRETLFWMAMEISEKVSNEMIISFNACSYVLSKIGLPPLVAGDAEVHKKLTVYKDSVAVIICLETENVAQCLDLWVFYDKYEGVECWCRMHTIEMLLRLERPVGILKDEILMSTDKVIRSVSGTIAFLPEDDVGAEFSYNVFNYVENFLFDGNVVVEEDDSLENDGLSLLNSFISNIGKLSIEDCVCY